MHFYPTRTPPQLKTKPCLYPKYPLLPLYYDVVSVLMSIMSHIEKI